MAGFNMLFRLLAGVAGGNGGGGGGMGSGLGRMVGQGLAKGLSGSLGGGMGRGKGGGQGGGTGGQGCGQGRGRGQGQCRSNDGQGDERLVKIVELVARRLAERNAGQTALDTTAANQSALDAARESVALPGEAAAEPARTIDIKAVSVTSLACPGCGRRISIDNASPLADPRCPQCGGAMEPARDA